MTLIEKAGMTLQMLVQSFDPDDWSIRAMINASCFGRL
jgi:hypothetical protein